MASAVQNLQNAILNGSKPLTQLLRETKVIASKLNLPDVESWAELELKGYPAQAKVPDYRYVYVARVEAYNPVRGWCFVGNVNRKLRAAQPMAEIENYAKSEILHTPLDKNVPMEDSFTQSWPQRFALTGASFQKVVDAATDELLKWTLELQKQGIEGENMSFDEKEKQAAASQTFHIGNIGSVTGVLGNVTNSQVAIYDYGTVHQVLKDKGVPQDQRNELENILDELKSASPEKKPSLVQRGKAWLIRNKDILGTGAEIVAKVLNVTLP